MTWAADPRWLGLFAEYFMKTTAVLSLAVIAAALLRRRPAALRHFVLSAFLIGLVFLPLLPTLPTGWETRLLPSRPAAREIPGGGVPWTVAGPPQADRSGTAPAHLIGLPLAGGLVGADPLDVALPFRAAAEKADGARSPSGNAVKGRALIGSAERMLPFVWAAGIALLLLRLGLGLVGAARLSRQGRPLVGPVWEAALREFLAIVSLRRRVRLKSHGRVSVPMTWGVVRPVVLFPEDCPGWDEGRRSAALFHELSHIKRADFAVMLLVRLSLALYWFNPLVWVVFRRLRREQEKACDELVLKAGLRPSLYARSLLLFKKPPAGVWSPSAALLGLSAGSSLGDRLTAILGHDLTNKEIAMKTRIGLIIAIVFIVSLIGSARPASSAVDKPAPAAVTAAPSAVPAPSQETAAVAQEKQEVEKKKEAEKAEKEKKAQEKQKITKTIIVTTPEGAKDRIRLSTTEGDVIKNLVLDHPSIVLEAAGPGDEVRLKINGNDVVLKKGDRLVLESKDGGLKVLGEGDVRRLKVEVPVLVKVDTTSPKVFTIREAPEAAAVKEIVIKPVVVAEAAAIPGVPEPAARAVPGVPAPTAQAAPAPPKEATTYKVIREGKPYTLTMTPRAPEKPYPPTARYSVVPEPEGALSRKEIRDKLQAVLEELKALEQKKPDVREDLMKIEESLHAITEKLGRTEAGLKVYEADGEKGATYVKVMTKEGEGKGTAYSYAYGHPSQRDKSMVYIGIGEGADFTVHYGGRHVLDDKAAVERAIADVKGVLPEGYGLESELDKDAETLVLKIKVPEGQKDHKGLIKKVIAILEEDLKPAPVKKD